MFHHIVIREDKEEDDEEEAESETPVLKPKVGLRNKIQFVSKMLKMQKLLREENENIILIKSMNNNKLPQGILVEGKEALDSFTSAKIEDSQNEMRPND